MSSRDETADGMDADRSGDPDPRPSGDRRLAERFGLDRRLRLGTSEPDRFIVDPRLNT